VGPGAPRHEAGELKLPREDILFFATPHERSEREQHARHARARHGRVGPELRRVVSRRQMRQIADVPARYVPGFEESYPVQKRRQVGVRETRRRLGEYQLTAQRRPQRAQISSDARARLPDRHPQSGAAAPVLKRLPPARPTTFP
jgi:hypothetical protein